MGAISTVDSQTLLSATEQDTPKGLGEFTYSMPESQLFDEGQEVIASELGIQLNRDPGARASLCGIKPYCLAKPQQYKGYSPKEQYKFMLPLAPEQYKQMLKDVRELYGAAKLSTDAANFWRPFFDSSITKQACPLTRYTQSLQDITEMNLAQMDGTQGFEQYININPNDLPEGLTPRAYVPESEWLSEKVRELRPEHILTLFPEPELKLFMLFLGRTLCGRDNSIPMDANMDLLMHKYRKMCVIYGKDPGTGKSTMCDSIIKAMKTLGYKVGIFRSLGERFNMGDIYSSDLAFKDDNVKEGVARILASNEIKSVVTGSPQQCENKGTNAYTITPSCSVLFITNDFDQSQLYGKDTGVIDRLCMLYTRTSAELEDLRHTSKDERLSQSPDLRTYAHIEWLANQCDCDQEVIWYWLFRMSVDYFLEQLEAENLEKEIALQTSYLRFPITHSALQNVVSAMLLSILCRLGSESELPDLSNKAAIAMAGKCYAFVQGDPCAHIVRSAIHKHWSDNGRPATHPWHGFKTISTASVLNMLQDIDANEATPLVNLDAFIKLIFSCLHTRDNIGIGSGKAYVSKAWANSTNVPGRKAMKEIAQLVEQMMAEPKLARAKTSLLSLSQPARLEYVNHYGYSPIKLTNCLEGQYKDTADTDQVNFMECTCKNTSFA